MTSLRCRATDTCQLLQATWHTGCLTSWRLWTMGLLGLSEVGVIVFT